MTGNAQVKTHLRGPGRILRSKIRRELEKIQVGTFTGPAGTFRQRTELTRNQRQILKTLEIEVPPRIYQVKLPAEPD